MKKLLEFRLFDLLKDKDNEVFLNKVKKENPDKYMLFVNILGRKGLEIAKTEYEEYDPTYVKIKKEKEKKEQTEWRKQNNKEKKEQQHDELLKKYSSEINEVNNILKNSLLKRIEKNIENDKNLSYFLKYAKTHYTKDFLKILKDNRDIEDTFKVYDYPDGTPRGYRFLIDTLSYSVDDEFEDSRIIILKISQYYILTSKKLTYNIDFNLDTVYELPGDRNKEKDFIEQRSNYLDKLTRIGLDKDELYKIIFGTFSKLLSKEVYDKWYEDWKLKNRMKKYNIAL